MIEFTTKFLLAALLLFGKVAWAEEKSSEHQKNISKAVSAQLLRMKLKKMGKIKMDNNVAKDLKRLPETSDLKAEDKKPDTASQQQNDQQPVIAIKPYLSKKTLTPVVKKETKKLQKSEEKQKKVVKTEEGERKNSLSNQQKNDSLRLKLQDLINSTPNN